MLMNMRPLYVHAKKAVSDMISDSKYVHHFHQTAFIFALMVFPSAFLCRPALAETSSVSSSGPETGADGNVWKVMVSPYVWGASLSGNAAIGGIGSSVDVPFSETLKNLQFALMGNIEVSKNAYGFFVDALYVDATKNEDVLPMDVDVGTTETLLSVGMFYRVYEKHLGGQTAFGGPKIFALEPTAGIRWTRLVGNLSAGPYSLSENRNWLDPFVGLRVGYDLSEHWKLTAQADVGGFDVGSRVSVNGQAYLGYRVFLLGQPTFLRAGYRIFYQDYEKRGFKWDVNQNGPVVGLSVFF